MHNVIFFTSDQKNGTATPCVVTSMIETLPDKDDADYEEEDRIRRNAASVAFGGSETVSILTVMCTQEEHITRLFRRSRRFILSFAQWLCTPKFRKKLKKR